MDTFQHGIECPFYIEIVAKLFVRGIVVVFLFSSPRSDAKLAAASAKRTFTTLTDLAAYIYILFEYHLVCKNENNFLAQIT